MIAIAARRIVAVGFAGIVGSAASPPRHAVPRPAQSETVMVTYHIKRGAEADLARVLVEHWATALRLQLVDSAPHLILKTADGSQSLDIVEIFTWRDAATPDNAPPEIQAAWSRMAPLVESRGGHPAIEPVEVSIVR